MTPGGTITGKDLFSDDAFKFGEPLVKEYEKVIKAQKELIAVTLEYDKANNSIRKVVNQQQFIDEKQKLILLDQQAISIIKQKETAEISADKIKRSNIATIEAERKAKQSSTDAEEKSQKAKKETVKLTIDERIQNEINNKLLKQEALERLNLVTAYSKLSKARTDAKIALKELILTEGASTAKIDEAQKAFDILDAKVRKADKAVGDFSKNVGNYPQISSLNNTLKDLVGSFGLVAGVGAFSVVLKDAFETVKVFDQGIADLSAITGATGDDLDYLKNKAIELGRTTSGGAVAVVEAYKLIGSAKPELLSNVEALNQVTEATITLSKASGLELPAAATALTDALNQFGAPAEQAGKFIDVLAAGAKYGAAEIPQITDALLKFGAVARTSNVSIQESTALVELLAENGLKGADAGTALRNVLLKLSAPDALPKEAQIAIKKLGISFSDLKDESKPIQERLELLKPLLKDNAGLIKVFGLENTVAATNILGHTDRLKVLTKQVDENGVVLKQAEIRSNTLGGATDRLAQSWNTYILKQNESSKVTGSFTKLIKYLANNLEEIVTTVVKVGSVFVAYLATTKAITLATEAYRAVSVASSAAQLAFAQATGIGTLATKAKVLATEQALAAETARATEQRISILVTEGLTIAEAQATVATEALNIATKATPWGLIIGLLAAAVAGYIAFSDNVSDAEKSLKKLKEESKRYKDQEVSTNKESDEFRNKTFKGIEDEIRLREKKGENVKKLSQEEINQKRKFLLNEIDTYTQLKDIQENDTKVKISESNKRIGQLKKEQELTRFKRGSGKRFDEVSDEIKSLEQDQKSRLNRLKDNSAITIAEKTKLNNLLNDLNRKSEEDSAEINTEANKKSLEKQKKFIEDYLKNIKDKNDKEFALNQFRLDRAIYYNELVLNDEKESVANRIDAYGNIEDLRKQIADNILEKELQNIALSNEALKNKSKNEIDQYIANSNNQIKQILKTGELKKNANKDEILAYEKYLLEIQKLNDKAKEDNQKIIDSEVASIKKKTDALLQAQEKELNEAITAENNKFLALQDGNIASKEEIEEHERQVNEIKKYYIKKALNQQMKAIEDLLLIDKSKVGSNKISLELIAKQEQDLAKLKKALSEEDLKEFKGTEEEKKKLRDQARKILSKTISETSKTISETFKLLNNGVGLDTSKIDNFFQKIADNFEKIKTGGKLSFEDVAKTAEASIELIANISNSLSQGRIAGIDAEIQSSDEFYSKEIENAGNDERKKAIIEKEKEKKRQELEKKKREEQRKQAEINKVFALAEIAVNTAKAVTSIASTGGGTYYADFGVTAGILTALAIANGVAQAAIVLSTPLPKYKGGRVGGIEEMAIVGDGGRNEIIQRKSGFIEMTPRTDTLVKLFEGDSVYSSVDDYQRYLKASMLTNISVQNGKMNDFQTNQIFNIHNEKLIDEMKLTRKAIEKNKSNVVVNTTKIDIPHSVWAHKNTNWN